MSFVYPVYIGISVFKKKEKEKNLLPINLYTNSKWPSNVIKQLIFFLFNNEFDLISVMKKGKLFVFVRFVCSN